MSEQAESARTDDDQPVAAQPVPPRPSRQSLVVKRRGPNGPLLALGAITSAAVGFAIVFTSGLGRSRMEPRLPDAAAVADVPGDQLGRATEPPEEAGSPPSPPRFFVPAASDQAGESEPVPLKEPETSRFAAQPVALEDAAGEEQASDGRASRFSTFSPSGTDAEPVGGPAEPARQSEPAAGDSPAGTDDAIAAEPEEASAAADGSASSDETAAEPATVPSPDVAARPASDATASAQDAEPASPPPTPAADPAAGPPPSGLRSPPLESTLAAALAPMQPAPSKPATQKPATPVPASAFEDPEAPIPVTPPGGSPSGTPDAQTPPNVPPAARPQQERIASVDVTRGFGAAPPITPGPNAAVPPAAAGEPAPDATAQALSTAAGLGSLQPDGRPGPIQLEGIQTPQLTIEKRGPREVQVGKVARYDMVVRNVGGVAAHEVTLRDRVPLGTKLVSTSPPAAPGEAGELVWALGSLPQGAQARVAMEVMPIDEGEVGSVASVSFRADASVRSVATRAALAIDVVDPKPVLVGSGMELSITVRNPGTGEATGVVLEGNLPKGFTHAAGSALEFDVGRLRPGESRRIDLKLVSTHPGVQPLKLVARADGRIETEQTARLEVTAPTLELTANMPSRRYLQRPATCVLSMNNGGTAPANTIELAAQLPPGMKFLRANNAGYYEEATHRVMWHLEQLPAAEVGSVEMVLVPTALGPQRIAAAARSADGLTSQVAHTVEVEGLAALLFEVGDSEDPIEVDGMTEYVVRVGNQGTKAATGVRVTATLLGDLEPIEAKGPAAHRIENLSILFEPLAKLAPAEESVYRIRVRGRREGDQRVQVQVTSDDSQSPITKEEVTRVYSDR